jgi:hypothetical protein
LNVPTILVAETEVITTVPAAPESGVDQPVDPVVIVAIPPGTVPPTPRGYVPGDAMLYIVSDMPIAPAPARFDPTSVKVPFAEAETETASPLAAHGVPSIVAENAAFPDPPGPVEPPPPHPAREDINSEHARVADRFLIGLLRRLVAPDGDCRPG